MKVKVDEDLIVATPVPNESFLVRLHPQCGLSYDRMILVTVEGDTLHLAGWIGKPLSLSQWYAAKEVLFPEAAYVRFERLRKDGFHYVKLPLRK